MYNINTHKQVAVHMCGFDSVQQCNYFGGEPIRKGESVKLKHGKAAVKDKVTEETEKGGGDIVVDWIWRLCNMALEDGIVPKDWRSAIIVPLYKDKGD